MNKRLSEAATKTNSMLSKLKLIEDDAEACADVAYQALTTLKLTLRRSHGRCHVSALH